VFSRHRLSIPSRELQLQLQLLPAEERGASGEKKDPGGLTLKEEDPGGLVLCSRAEPGLGTRSGMTKAMVMQLALTTAMLGALSNAI